ncbi:MAG: hypothetical protein GOP50_09040 [Candidatus Heimdallarchaeota archaeon]|nr:hypothetical protein [Candidatus Heimdallarchaeota archaeon]
MSFQDDVQALAAEGTVGVVWLMGDDLKCYYQYGDWAVDPTIPFNAFKNQVASIDFGGDLRFTVIAMTPERLVSSNLGGQGHIIVAKCPSWAGCVIAWCPSSISKDYAYASTARLAAKVG